MEVTLTVRKNFKVGYLLAQVTPRHWEDATVDGKQDKDGSLIPLREEDKWIIKIDIDTGVIQEWPKGTEADIHYKVCDAGCYALYDPFDNFICETHECVPKIMSPGGNGFGDYIIMKVDGEGKIENWSPTFDEFSL